MNSGNSRASDLRNHQKDGTFREQILINLALMAFLRNIMVSAHSFSYSTDTGKVGLGLIQDTNWMWISMPSINIRINSFKFWQNFFQQWNHNSPSNPNLIENSFLSSFTLEFNNQCKIEYRNCYLEKCWRFINNTKPNKSTLCSLFSLYATRIRWLGFAAIGLVRL